jgi:hypothetical protein
MITEELKAIFAGQDVEGDVDGVIAAYDRLVERATVDDIPELIAAIQSSENNFWTRELLSGPICHLDGPNHLEILFDAAQLGLDEGHDNDHFHFNLSEMAELESDKCRKKLKELLAQNNFRHREAAEWLLEYCETDKA